VSGFSQRFFNPIVKELNLWRNLKIFDTVSIILNDYLREFRTKLTARKDRWVEALGGIPAKGNLT